MKSGVFAAYAQKYFEMGMNVIPIGENKKPPYGFMWGEWQTKRQEQDDVDKLVHDFGQARGIAIVCGEVSGIVGFDFDYKFNDKKMPPEFDSKKYAKDLRFTDQMIRQYLPDQTCVKKAFEGWTAFYKWCPENRTVACDRNGVRLFDFKATGYIVMPPSFHSIVDGKEIYYDFIAGDIMDLESCVQISQEIVDELRFTLANGEKPIEQMKASRHGRLFIFAAQLCQTKATNAEIVKAMIEHDLKVNSQDPKGPYFKDHKHVGHKPEAYAAKWVERIRKCAKSQPKQTRPENEVWDYFIEKSFFECRKDILSKKLMSKKDEDSEWVDVDMLVPVLRSYAALNNLKKEDVADHVARFVYEKQDESFLCDIPEWDGTDYVAIMANALKSPDFTSEELAQIIKRWGARMFLRVKDSNAQNECLILKGPQNIGKDTWIKNLLNGFKPYYKNVIPPDSKKDFLEIVSRLYACHIEEFDQTGEVDVAFLKALITQDRSFFREAYGRGATDKTMAASFISSVNPDDFLRDPTGNRRFIVVPLSGIDFDYPKNISLDVLSQWFAIAISGGYAIDKSVQDKINGIMERLSPEDPGDVIEQIYLERFIEYCGASSDRWGAPIRPAIEVKEAALTQNQAQALIKSIADMVRYSPQKVRSILKIRGYQKRKTTGRYWIFTPEIDSRQ